MKENFYKRNGVSLAKRKRWLLLVTSEYSEKEAQKNDKVKLK